jgi:hypothetical protein
VSLEEGVPQDLGIQVLLIGRLLVKGGVVHEAQLGAVPAVGNTRGGSSGWGVRGVGSRSRSRRKFLWDLADAHQLMLQWP